MTDESQWSNPLNCDLLNADTKNARPELEFDAIFLLETSIIIKSFAIICYSGQYNA